MTDYRTLQRRAGIAAVKRGHTMAGWTKLENKGMRQTGESLCAVCGAAAQINARPAPNEIDIGGSAMAMDCPGKSAAPRAVTLPGHDVKMAILAKRWKADDAAPRPVQFQQDAIEIADAYLTGGNRLARLVFNSIVDARKLKLFESVVLRGDVRDRLVKAGVKFSV